MAPLNPAKKSAGLWKSRFEFRESFLKRTEAEGTRNVKKVGLMKKLQTVTRISFPVGRDRESASGKR